MNLPNSGHWMDAILASIFLKYTYNNMQGRLGLKVIFQ
jgi:hypothetical protein